MRKSKCIIATILIYHNYTQGVFKGGWGSGGSNPTPPPPPKFSDFFLKSEGKEIERKRRDVGGGVPLNIFLGLMFFRVGLRYFQGGLRNFREGLRNFRGG